MTWSISKILYQTCSKLTKKSYKNIGSYNIGYITIKKFDDYESISGVNPSYLQVNHRNGYIEEKNGYKYLVFNSTDENKEVLKKYADVWNGIKNKTKEINVRDCDCEKDFMKIKFNSHDDLPWNKPLKLLAMTLMIRSVFEEHGKLYPQVFSDDALYEV